MLSKLISGAGAWSVRYTAQAYPGFSVVLQGGCFLAVDGLKPVELQEGDFVLLPATPGFTMTSDLRLKPKPLEPSAPRELRHGNKAGPPSMRMLGGYFELERDNADMVLRLLPKMILIRADAPNARRLHTLVELIASEATSARPGRDLVLARLVEVLLVEALRFEPAREEMSPGLLAGLLDPGLAKALEQIHAKVAHPWTVGELARRAGMSRAVFADRFHRTVGLPPMQYLLEWRMALAKNMLRYERPPLAEVAERVGYQSASAFSTAFSRLIGCAPSKFAA